MSFFKNIFKWIYLKIRSFFVALYKGVKFLCILIYKGIIYLFKGIYIVFKYLAKGIYYLFKYIIKYLIIIFKFIYKILIKVLLFKFFVEIYIIFRSFGKGIFSILKFIFYQIPKFIAVAISNFFSFLYSKTKNTLKAIFEFLKAVPGKISKYFSDKWNNLALVKYYRNKRDRNLEVLFIDKNSKDAERSEVKQTYRYLARNKDGKLVKGYFSALSKLDTHSYLLDEGYEVYKIETSKWINFVHGESRTLRVRMRYKDLIFWLTQISTYVKSGIPLTDAIKILAKQDKRKKYQKIYDSIIYELTMGESFSKALEKQDSVFPGLLVNMIAAAELIGDIESTLDEMATYYKEIEDTRKSIINAMTYPAIIFVFAIGVVVFILLYIIPQFVDVYNQVGVALNPVTILVLNLSDFLKRKYLLIILGVVAVIILHKVAMKNLKAYKTFVQYIYMHIPVVGKIIIYNEINLFAKTFSALNKNNVLLTDTMDILSKITNNEIYKMIMYDTVSNLLRGDKMSVAFKNNWAVPDIAYYMITTGESTGELPTMLDKVSEFYQKQQKNMVTALKNFIEPILIVFLAVVVGGIILSVIVPLFSLYSAL